jgi:hypothetical protein
LNRLPEKPNLCEDEKRGALFVDLNTISADKYDALGQQATRALFNDTQHSRKAGAHLNAESVVAGIKGLKDCPLAMDFAPGVLNGHAAQPGVHAPTPPSSTIRDNWPQGLKPVQIFGHFAARLNSLVKKALIEEYSAVSFCRG